MKNELQKTKIIGLSLLALILILSIDSYKLIPFGNPDGLDFHNLYSYSKCNDLINKKFEGNIYLATGTDCKDAMGRPFVYPPLLYFSTQWVRIFDTFESARLAWRIFILLGVLWSLFIWLGTWKRFFYSIPFTFLLYLQFPMLFALERANNDILVLLLWTLAYQSYKKSYFKISGYVSICTVLMKVYPFFAIFIPVMGLFISNEYGKLKKFLYGVIFGIATNLVLFYWLWYSFYQIIKEFSGHKMVFGVINHSVQYLSEIKALNIVVFVSLVIVWVYRMKYTKNETDINFAGALAISTFYSATSFDYNLITAYPLIIIMIENNIEKFSFKRFIILIGIVVGVCGNRYMFIWNNDMGYRLRLVIQILSLGFVAIEALPLFKLRNLIIYKYNKAISCGRN